MIGASNAVCKWDPGSGTSLFIRCSSACMRSCVIAGKYVFIHSCGDVDELFDDLIGIGLNCFNPFQPEVMDVAALMERYRGRLTFHGGLSTQRTLPFGTVEDVRAETQRLLKMGAARRLYFCTCA